MDMQFVWSTLAQFFNGPVGAFLAYVAIDDAFGVALAFKTGGFDKEKGGFSWSKLLSFVESQFATKTAVAIAVMALAVFLTDGSGAAWVGLVAACGKASLDVVMDIKNKLFALAGMPVTK